MSDRITRLRAALPALGAGSFLVTRSVNVRYLTGFDSSNTALAVGADRVVLATDGRYVESARTLDGDTTARELRAEAHEIDARRDARVDGGLDDALLGLDRRHRRLGHRRRGARTRVVVEGLAGLLRDAGGRRLQLRLLRVDRIAVE